MLSSASFTTIYHGPRFPLISGPLLVVNVTETGLYAATSPLVTALMKTVAVLPFHDAELIFNNLSSPRKSLKANLVKRLAEIA